MKIGVLGLWHLGSVTAACLAEAGYETIGIDFDEAVVAKLGRGSAPLFEPGLDDLLAAGLASGRLSFASDAASMRGCDLVWVAYDTPVDDEDRADTGSVIAAIERLFPYLSNGTIVLISSQLPVGCTRAVAESFSAKFPGVRCRFAYSPENLRLGRAIEIFKTAERIIVGCDDAAAEPILRALLGKFTDTVLWMSLESAEMVKHSVNAFLATSVTFANEIAAVCEIVGANAADVERALRLEPRIGPRAYIKPGASFAGGTLARDVVFLNGIAAKNELQLPLLAGILPSNHAHQQWPVRRLVQRLGDLSGRVVAVLGLAYKPGTDTLRRSSSLELCRALAELGATVQAFDPAVHAVPPEDGFIEIKASMDEALSGADAALIGTEWSEFKSLTAERCLNAMRSPLICDPNGFLASNLDGRSRIDYIAVGRP
jgi:UDPglucose 6-dehydrogenase